MRFARLNEFVKFSAAGDVMGDWQVTPRGFATLTQNVS